jgi:hypothetical protein
MGAVANRQSNPSRGEDAPKLPVREQGDLSVQLTKVRNKPVGSVGNLPGRLTPGAAVEKDIPIGTFFVNVRGASSLVSTIIPFGEVWFAFSALA